MNQFPYVIAITLFNCANLVLADSISLGKYTLAPGEKKAVVVDTKNEITVGFTNLGSVDEAKQCRKMCIHMTVLGNQFLDASAAIGTTMKIAPTKGKIQVQFENLEAFPISIDVFRE